MRFFNWAKIFEESPTCDDILKRVRKTEVIYWVYALIAVGITLAGITKITEAPDGDMKEIAFGLLIAIFGVVQIALMKLWAAIRLTMYFLIWDRNNTIEAEIKKSELQDL